MFLTGSFILRGMNKTPVEKNTTSYLSLTKYLCTHELLLVTLAIYVKTVICNFSTTLATLAIYYLSFNLGKKRSSRVSSMYKGK